MRQIVKSRFVGAALVAALAAAGCGGGGGGSSGSTSGSATAGGGGAGTGGSAGSTTNPSTGFTGVDTTDPTFAADAASGANTFHVMAQGRVVTLRGTADDSESGVKTVKVNGAFAVLGGTPQQSTWEASLAARDGINLVNVEVEDQQGNRASGWWSICAAERFLAAQDAVANAAVVYVTDSGFTAFSTIANAFLTQNNGIVQAFANQALNLPLTASLGGVISANVTSVTFGTPQLTLAPTAQGLSASVTVPTVQIDAFIATFGQTLTVTADAVTVGATVAITVANGQYQVAMSNITANVVNPQVQNLAALGPTLGPIVQALLPTLSSQIGGIVANAVQSSVPGAIQSALNGFTPSYSQDVLGVTFTATAQPTAITYSAQGVEIAVEANLTHNAQGRGAPGSLGFTSTAAPVFGQTHHANAALSAELVNRALFVGWDAGLLSYTIDQQLLSQFGINLPFSLSTVLPLIGILFPPIAAMGTPQDVGIQLAFDLPPSVGFDAQTPNVRAAYGGLRASIVMDFGLGYVPVLSLNVAGDISADVATSAQAIDIQLVNPTSVQFEVTANGNPLNLNLGTINTFLNMGISQAVNLFGSLVPSIPVPAIPSFNGFSVQVQTLDSEFQGRFVIVKATVQ